MKNARLLIVLLLFCLAVKAQQEFEFTANCRSAQEAILHLKFSSAKTLLLKERKANPNNLIPFYLDNYIDFLSIIISEEKSRFELVKANKDIRLELIEKGKIDKIKLSDINLFGFQNLLQVVEKLYPKYIENTKERAFDIFLEIHYSNKKK